MRTSKSMLSKPVVIFIALAMLFLCACNSETDEQDKADALAVAQKHYDAFTRADFETMAATTTKEHGEAFLANMAAQPKLNERMTKAVFSKFSYEIKSVSKVGKGILITLELRSPDMDLLQNEMGKVPFSRETLELLKDVQTQEEMEQILMDKMIEAIENSDGNAMKKEAKTMMVKEDGQWKINRPLSSNVADQ